VIKNLLRSLAEQGAAVLLSTHVLEVAENICDRVAIIDRGRIVAEGTLNDLQEQAKMPESNLEQVFLALTGHGNDRERVFTAR
jgi:ABC-2 type transport system ATP-binding protein